MGNGRKATAPCGHAGEVVIGTYVQCPRCDKGAVPTHVRPEKTEPMRRAACPHCASFDVEEFEDSLDAAMWVIGRFNTPMPQVMEWGCHGCGKVFAKPT